MGMISYPFPDRNPLSVGDNKLCKLCSTSVGQRFCFCLRFFRGIRKVRAQAREERESDQYCQYIVLANIYIVSCKEGR